MMRLRRAGLVAMALTRAGVVVSGSRGAPVVLVAAGFGLIGPVVWTNREAV
jgi:hypothetical protein